MIFPALGKGRDPPILQQQSTDPWRSHGDTIERLESLSLQLVTALVEGQQIETSHRQSARQPRGFTLG